MNKFCILAAGKGTRNNNVINLHKALLPLENKPIISHIIDKLDKKIEIVIAVGYKAEQVTSYIKAVHPNRNISFVEVDNYDGPGAGPGYSLLCCKPELQEPFVFTSVDTLIDTNIDIMNINENWLGTSDVDVEDSINYCLVNGSKYLDNLYYGTGNNAYIGLAGIFDYDKYWSALEEHKILKDEYQVIHGFDGLERIKLINFKWYDTGNNKAYEQVRKLFGNEIVANKSAEAIFIENGKVIKYFNDEKIIEARINRTKYLGNNIPSVTQINKNMFCYDYVPGKLLSEITDENVLNYFFDFCQTKLFTRYILYSKETIDEFLVNCEMMYEGKTKERLKSLCGSELDKIEKINGVSVEPIEYLLRGINWNSFKLNAAPSRFHGDLQPENIIFDSVNNKFVLIDWRDNFGSSMEVGDIYYDLSKLYHALLVNGSTILKGQYDCKIIENEAFINFYAKNNLIYLMDVFEKFCIKNNYNWQNVKLLGILHYLNICPLYENFQNGQYGKFLFLYGKLLLTKFLGRHEQN